MLKSEFLRSWRGSALAPGVQNQWVRAEGSSLSDCERNALSRGRIITHDKLFPFKKIFAMDEQSNLWSIIIKDAHMTPLVSALCDVGFESVVV